jgi:hypothetical protein
MKYAYPAILVFIIFASNYLVEVIGKWHYAQSDNKQPFDLAHYFLPDFHKHKWLVNILPLTLLVFIFFQNNATYIFKTAIFLLIVILFIRALTTLSTILPKHEECIEPDLLTLMLGGGCYDKVFSGHMSFVALFSLILLEQKNITLPIFVGLNLLQAAIILLARTHYTVDVILGFVITYLVYDGDYHIFTNFFKGIGGES